MRYTKVLFAILAVTAACGSDGATGTTEPVTSSNPVTMSVSGRGDFKPVRTTGEVIVRGTTAYTTTWGNTTAAQGEFFIWDVSGSTPTLVDSVHIDQARTLGDVAVSDDGTLLIVATEQGVGSIVIYSLANPRKPVQISRFSNNSTVLGVHTAEIGRVNGRLYGFLSIDPGSGVPAQLVIVDLSNPASPQQVYQQFIGTPYVHDTFVRDGYLFLGLWDDGVAVWDIGGAGTGGTPSSPKELGRLRTINGHVHNIWWLKDPVTNSNRFAFIGEESPGSVGASSSGDIHVVDVSNPAQMKEVAYYTVAAAGTHNFSVDEQNGILYAAYYNGGVRALDVRGDLSTCDAAQRSTPANSSVSLCDLRKMGRELGIGLLDRGNPVYVWGVQYLNGAVYASDMINGIWKLQAVSRP
jgi:hypothetical protein